MALVFPKGETHLAEKLQRMDCIKPNEVQGARIAAACQEWVLGINYYVTYDDDDGETVCSDLRYKELNSDNIILKGDEPVGVMLTHRVHYHNSNCTDTYLYALYFRDAPDHSIRLEGARSGNHYVEGTASYFLRRRADVPAHKGVETAGSQFFPVPDVH